MNINNQLRAIYGLSMKDGLSYSELSDITTWRERAGLECDTNLLTEKSRERITAIFRRYFKGV